MNRTTLAAEFALELEVKKSRFLAKAYPIDSSEQAIALLSQHSDAAATHNCWAYRIGQQYRSSDDGEPAGTAGRPILAAIDGSGLDAVMLIVTRWFGGIKLGAGGLVRAYGGAAAECLRQAPRKMVQRRQRCSLHCGFEWMGLVYSRAQLLHASKLDETHDADGVHLHFELAAADLPAFASSLRDGSRGQLQLELEP